MKNYNIIYAVIRESEIEYASIDEQEAEDYAEELNDTANVKILNMWGNEDPTVGDIREASFQAGIDGDFYRVEKIDLTDKTEEDDIELSDGTEIYVEDILKVLKKSS